MLDQQQRVTILKLHEEGHGARAIAGLLRVSRGAVRRVLRARSAEVPRLARTEKGEEHREEVVALYDDCKGNLVRVHEVLVGKGATLSYQALTAFCRRHGIGREPKVPAGRYEFAPGEEMQHDTSPHVVELDGRKVKAQTASLVLAHSRMLFFQHYPTFDRFTCKIFLTEAMRFFGGAAARCMIDNTHVVVLRGSGRTMEPVPEMAAFAERFGFQFVAHEIGDANRSARVERPFDHIENNFLAHRPAKDLADLNGQARAWCEKVNATPKRALHAAPRELFAMERLRLRPLPAFIPEVYLLHHRIVDVEGYVCVHTLRYSAPVKLIGRRVEVRETKDTIEIFEGPRLVATHQRVEGRCHERITLPEHRAPRGQGPALSDPPEQQELKRAEPEIDAYLGALRAKTPGRAVAASRRLLRMVREYPRAPLLDAVRSAHAHGLFDLDRLDRMVLQRIARDFFPRDPEDDA